MDREVPAECYASAPIAGLRTRSSLYPRRPPMTPRRPSTRLEIGPAEAADKVADGAQLIDVRQDYEWEAGRIAGAEHIPLEQLPAAAERFDQDRPIVFQCRTGSRSALRDPGLPGVRLRGLQPRRRPRRHGSTDGSRDRARRRASSPGPARTRAERRGGTPAREPAAAAATRAPPPPPAQPPRSASAAALRRTGDAPARADRPRRRTRRPRSIRRRPPRRPRRPAGPPTAPRSPRPAQPAPAQPARTGRPAPDHRARRAPGTGAVPGASRPRSRACARGSPSSTASSASAPT